MKSNAPWSVKGIERDARETAKEAARRQGMTVGEWLNQMIYTAGDPERSDGNIEGLKVTDLVTAIEHLNKRLAEMESSSSMAFSELSRNVGGIVERTQRLERSSPADTGGGDLAARVEHLERGGKDRQRVEALKALEKAVAQVAVQFNNAQKTSLERIDATEQQIQQLAERMDEGGAVSGDEATSGVAFLKDAFDGLSARVARAEKIAGEATRLKSEAAGSGNPEFVEQTGARLRVLGDEIKRGGDQIRALEGIVTKLSEQIDAAELRSAEGIQKVSESIADLASRVTHDGDRNQERAEINAAIETARKDADERIAELQQSLTEAIAKSEAPRPVIAAVNEPEPAEPEEETKPLAFDISNDIEEIVSDNEDPIAAISEESDETDLDTNIDPDLGADPFSLEDEGDDEASSTTSDSDDFSFDFDDEDDVGNSATPEVEEDPASNEARALLSEVRQAFGSPDEHTDGDQTSEDTSAEIEAADDNELVAADGDFSNDETDDHDDLDSIFAELDALKEGATQDSGETDDDATGEGNVRSVKARAKALLAGNETGEPDDEQPGSNEEFVADADEGEDFLKAARRRAQEAALEAADTKKRTRRNLTPKQKAILAARARQKRREEREDSIMSTPAPAPAFDTDEDDEADEVNKSLFAKVTGLFGSKSDRDDDKDDVEDSARYASSVSADDDDSQGDNKAAFATLKSAITARPMTLVLGVAIILTAVALFFLVKDLVSQPNLDGTRQTEASSSATPGRDAETVAELPAAPTINPRTLYSDSMTALNSATEDAQISAAIVKLQDAAALGFPPAQLQLGELYKTGQGLEQDLGQARIWFRRAANGGNVLAMHRIGVMTARGDGGAADTREAIGWFERAASFGLVDSQYNLGAIFHPSANGDPTPVQDAGQAYFWYSLAARSGDTQAGPLAAGVAGSLNAEERQEIDSMIDSWVSETPDPAANEIAVTN